MIKLVCEKYKSSNNVGHLSATKFLYWMPHPAFSSNDINYLHLLLEICLSILKIFIYKIPKVLLNI